MPTGAIENKTTNPAFTQQNLNSDQVGSSTSVSGGVGAMGGDTPAPPPTMDGAKYAAAFTLMFASALLTPNRPADMEVVLAEVSAALKETRDRTEGEKIKTDQEKIRTSQQEQQEKLAERSDKIEESIANEAKSEIGRIFQRIFQVLALVVSIAVAAIAFATGVGVAIGVAMIAAIAIQAWQLADGITQDATGTSIVGHAARATAEARGMSPSEADEYVRKAEEVVGWTLMAVSIALAIVTLGGAGISSLKSVAGTGFAKAFAMGTKIGNEVADATSAALQVALKASKIANYAEAATNVAEGVSTGFVSGYSYAAAQANADAMKLKGEGDTIAASMKALEDLIDQALKALMAAQDATAAMLDAASSAMQERGNTFNRTSMVG